MYIIALRTLLLSPLVLYTILEGLYFIVVIYTCCKLSFVHNMYSLNHLLKPVFIGHLILFFQIF